MFKQRRHLLKWQHLMCRICTHKEMHKPMYCSKIVRFFKCADSQVRYMLKDLVEWGFIKRLKKGRIKKIVLTEKGEQACSGIRELKDAFRMGIVWLFKH